MAALAFLLECAATAALIGMAVSLLVWSALLILRGRVLQRVPALRAALAPSHGHHVVLRLMRMHVRLSTLESLGTPRPGFFPIAPTAFLHHTVETALHLLF